MLETWALKLSWKENKRWPRTELAETFSFKEGRRGPSREHGKDKPESGESPREAMAGETL